MGIPLIILALKNRKNNESKIYLKMSANNEIPYKNAAESDYEETQLEMEKVVGEQVEKRSTVVHVEP